MTGQTIRKASRVALALVLAADLSGCVSVSTTRTRGGPAGTEGSLEVAVYDTPAKAKAGIPTSGSVSLELGRLEKGRPEASVQSFATPSASFGSLAPGEYSLHLTAAGPAGSGSAAAPTITQESIKVAAGETVRTRVILKEFPYRAVGGAVLCVGAGVGIAYALVKSLFNFKSLGNSNLSLSQAPTPRKTQRR